MSQSSIHDYRESLRAALGRAIGRTQLEVQRELNSASQMGHYGSTIQRSVDRLHREFDTGILVTLARLRRARKKTRLEEHPELWQATVQELENFARGMKSAVDVDGLATLRLSDMTMVRAELVKLDEYLVLGLLRLQKELSKEQDEEAKVPIAKSNAPVRPQPPILGLK
jgi:predicted acetyltransferase